MELEPPAPAVPTALLSASGALPPDMRRIQVLVTFKSRVRERQEKHGETYSSARKHVADTASSTVEVRKTFRRLAEDMRKGRAAWTPGPKLDLDDWLAVPVVPMEAGVETPSRPLLVVDVGALDCPVSELLARGVVRKSELVQPDVQGSGFLGTVTVEDDEGVRTVYRLPPPLGTWAAGEIGYTRSRGDFLPAYVGFCSPRPGYFGAVPMPAPAPTDAEIQRSREGPSGVEGARRTENREHQ